MISPAAIRRRGAAAPRPSWAPWAPRSCPMVCNVTIGKKGYEGVEAEMRAILHESEKSAPPADGDGGRGTSTLSTASWPHTSFPRPPTRKRPCVRRRFRPACAAPPRCRWTAARVCAEVIALSRRASEHGYLNVISDGGVGVLAGLHRTAQRRAQCLHQCARPQGIVPSPTRPPPICRSSSRTAPRESEAIYTPRPQQAGLKPKGPKCRAAGSIPSGHSSPGGDRNDNLGLARREQRHVWRFACAAHRRGRPSAEGAAHSCATTRPAYKPKFGPGWRIPAST